MGLTRALGRRELGLVVATALSIGGVASLIPALGRSDPPWWFDLLAPFTLHGAVGLGVAALILIAARARVAAGGVTLLTLVAVVRVVPLWSASPGAVPVAARLTVLHLNVNAQNVELTALAALIQSSDADLVSVVELSPNLARKLAELPPPWRPLLLRPSRDAFGIGVYARRAASSTRSFALGEVLPQIEAVVEVGGAEVVLLAVHVMPPFDAETTRDNRRQLRQLASYAQQARRPVLLVGDFNATPWSEGYGALVAAGLSRGARRFMATWPAPLGPLGIPIDHALVSPELLVTEIDAVEIPGSDHRGVRVVLAPRAP